jgi:urease accessory protein
MGMATLTIMITHMTRIMCTMPTADTITRMGTEPTPLLGLIWLASPALPVGGFSYSDGLESAIEHGLVRDEDSCSHWLLDQLWLIQVRGDMAVIAQAMQAWPAPDVPRLQQLAHWVMATRESAEARLQTEQMGRSMLDWLRNLHPTETPALSLLASLPPNYPLAMSLALKWTNSTVEQALQAYAFGWAENMTQAALKAVPLGQSSGQRLLARLVQDIPAAVQAALQISDDDRQAFSPMWAILSSRHETQYSRLFRS